MTTEGGSDGATPLAGDTGGGDEVHGGDASDNSFQDITIEVEVGVEMEMELEMEMRDVSNCLHGSDLELHVDNS